MLAVTDIAPGPWVPMASVPGMVWLPRPSERVPDRKRSVPPATSRSGVVTVPPSRMSEPPLTSITPAPVAVMAAVDVRVTVVVVVPVMIALGLCRLLGHRLR